MTSEIKFGTDGWRGRIADDFTFENVRRCAQGFARYLLDAGKSGHSVVVGFDRRFASEDFAAACAEVMAGNGFSVWLTDGATPTPVITYAVVDKGAVGAINITASHNPPADNGFKVRDHRGAAVDPDGLLAIEAAIPQAEGVKRLDFQDALAQGLVTVFDAAEAYLAHLHTMVDVQPIRDAGLNIVVEPMWGNGAGWFPRILAGGRTRVTEIHSERNPIFPEMARPEPIRPNVDVGLRKTVELGADVCLITDGDADRMGIGDEHGVFINQLQVFGLLALYYLEVRKERGPIVRTLSSTSMLDKLGELYGVDVHETGVGFKYVAPRFVELDAILGGEESGGYAFRGNVPERDGILGNLLMLDFMVKTGKKPSQLLAWLYEKVGEHYYERVDIRLQPDEYAATRERTTRLLAEHPPTVLDGAPVVKSRTDDGFKYYLPDGSWLLIRFSGTEPLMRIYTETTSLERVQRILQAGRDLAGVK